MGVAGAAVSLERERLEEQMCPKSLAAMQRMSSFGEGLQREEFIYRAAPQGQDKD